MLAVKESFWVALSVVTIGGVSTPGHLLGGSPSDSGTKTTRREVDLIELNHFIDDQGREVFQQLVFYDWSRPDQCFHVRAWRLVKKQTQLPRRHWKPKGYLCTWQDNHKTREVWSESLRETWSQKDPERVNREILPENQRKPLWPKPRP